MEILTCDDRKNDDSLAAWHDDLGTLPKVSKEVGNLGITMDSKLSMNAQVNKLARSRFLTIKTLRQIIPHLGFPHKVQATISLVLSKLDYANSLYHGSSLTTMKRLQQIHNSAARLLLHGKPQAHISPALRALHWLPVDRRSTFKMLCITHKEIHGTGPLFIRNKITKYIQQRNLSSRLASHLKIPPYKKQNIGVTSFSVQAAKP